MVALFVSSAMTYRQQSLIPLLEKTLANQPFRSQMTGVDFDYAGTTISIAHLGYFNFIEFFIRKAAHVLTFMTLAGVMMIALRKNIQPRGLRAVLIGLSACGVAALDEAHQMLTGGRSPLFQDVLLDTCAACVGILIVLLMAWRRPTRWA
nr:VanZ family protein [Lacticaseibacillus yichunensis]